MNNFAEGGGGAKAIKSSFRSTSNFDNICIDQFPQNKNKH